MFQTEGGDNIQINYKEIKIGSCADEILLTLSNPANGLCRILL
jgi:hypothetical protein